jgi:microsomal epoxide hydrolase
MYRGRVEDAQSMEPVPKGAKITKPVGIAAFPFDLSPFPPRSLAERSLNIVHWTDFAEGGHFAALERGEDLVNDVRGFARKL